MEKLNEEQKAKLKKICTDRLRIQLSKAGYDEEACLTLDRQGVLDARAEIWSKPVETKTLAEVQVAGIDQ